MTRQQFKLLNLLNARQIEVIRLMGSVEEGSLEYELFDMEFKQLTQRVVQLLSNK